MFTRKELQKIKSKAVQSLKDVTNPHWIHAYDDLASAADRLDALIARSEAEGKKFGFDRNEAGWDAGEW